MSQLVASTAAQAETIVSAGTIDEGGFGRGCVTGGGWFTGNGAEFGCFGDNGGWTKCWRIIDGAGSHKGVCYSNIIPRLKTGAKGPLVPPASLTSPLGGTNVVGDSGSSGLGGSGNSGGNANDSGLRASVGASSSNPGGNGGKHAIGPAH